MFFQVIDPNPLGDEIVGNKQKVRIFEDLKYLNGLFIFRVITGRLVKVLYVRTRCYKLPVAIIITKRQLSAGKFIVLIGVEY